MESNTMLSIYFFLLFLNQPFDADTSAKKKPAGDLEFKIVYVRPNSRNSSCLNTKILIKNNTDTAASFFEDWNMWGWFNIRLEIKTADTTYILEKKDRDWDKNFPSYETLFPGDSLELKYLLSFGTCDSSQFNNILYKPTSIRAIYRLGKEVLESAELKGEIKYKYHYIPDHLIIIDSLKNPVEINRTFPTTEFRSKEYILTN
jgi:hypothetical protein